MVNLKEIIDDIDYVIRGLTSEKEALEGFYGDGAYY